MYQHEFEKSLPLGEGAEQSEADEGRYARYSSRSQANWCRISLISHHLAVATASPRGSLGRRKRQLDILEFG